MILPDDYVEAINQAPQIWLVIMGKDRYKNDWHAIPFLKNDWSKLKNNNCSGGHVLKSLGFKLKGEDFRLLRKRYPEPRDLFLHLARSGVVFLNLVYEFLGENVDFRWDNEEHCNLATQADLTNAPYCSKAWYVLLCGQAKKRARLPSHFLAHSFQTVHPAAGCSNNNDPIIKARWQACWSQDAIFNWVKPVTELHQALTSLREGP